MSGHQRSNSQWENKDFEEFETATTAIQPLASRPNGHAYRRSNDFGRFGANGLRKASQSEIIIEPYRRPPGSGYFTRKRLVVGVVVLIVLAFLSRWSHPPQFRHPRHGQYPYSGLTGPRDKIVFENGTVWKNPEHFKIIGIVFYGRRQFVDILDCYLRRNLKVNGGMLDEVHFLMHTSDEDDKNWLREMVKEKKMETHYKLVAEDTDVAGWNIFGTFQELYKEFMTDKNAIYVKMDDDLLFIDDYTIPELLRVTLEYPEAHSVQANIINNKQVFRFSKSNDRWNYWFHYRAGAVWPYLPEEDKTSRWTPTSWRPSELPRYAHPLPNKQHLNYTDLQVPSQGHRWLPLDATYDNLDRTPYGPFLPNPMFHTRDTAVGWAVTAQSHFSFLENFERRQLEKYSWGNVHGIWNPFYTRYNINMMAIRGSYLWLRPMWEPPYEKVDKGDELLLTTLIPQALSMPVYIATRAVAVHFSFRGDREMMLQTDVLDRYRALGNELVCKADNQKVRFGTRHGPHHEVATPEGGGTEPAIGDGPQDIINKPDEGPEAERPS